MQLIAFGVNHQTAPLAIREQVAFPAEHLGPALRNLVEHNPVREAAIISTCNRTEVYCSTADPLHVKQWLAQYHSLATDRLDPFLYELPSEQAVSHAFRVASGLDSMVLGEAQILGQMKQAVREAKEAGTLGTVLHKLFQHTFSVAKEVRTRTDIGASSVSLAAAAVRIAERIYPDIADQSLLFIGAGEMIELCATHFCARNPRSVTFANRTTERAADLADRFSARSVALSELPQLVALHDIIVTCTASPLPIVGKGLIERALKLRRHRPILIVDLAVPRDVELEVGGLGDVFLYTVDDLGTHRPGGRREPAVGGDPGRGDHHRGRQRFHAVAADAQERPDDPCPARPRGAVAAARGGTCRESAGTGRRSGRGAGSPLAWHHQQVSSRPDGRAARCRQ